MAVRAHGNGYQIDVTVAGKRAPRLTFPTRAAALGAEATVKANMLAGRAPDHGLARATPNAPATAKVIAAGGATMLDAQEWTFASRWRGLKTEASVMALADHILEDLGHKLPIAAVDLAKVQVLVDDWHTRGNSPATINRKLAALSVMLETARERVPSLVPFKIPRQREYEGRLRWFSDEEVESLLKTARRATPDLAFLLEIALHTGARYGELRDLRVRDVKLAGEPSVTFWVTKGDKPRTLPLTGELAELVAAAVKRRGLAQGDPLVDPQFTPGYLSRFTLRWKRRQGLPNEDEACFHTWRHTCCSRLIQRGVPLAIVKEWMGHAQITTTMRYAHLAPTSLNLALAALEK